MTSLIEKIAFMPPRRAYAERVLQDRVGYVTSRLGHKVSYLDLLPSNPGRCISASGEGQPSSHTDASRRYSGAPFSPLYTMIYAHGNAEDLAYGCRDLTFLANKLGIRIVPYDYPGYGLSEPIKPTEEAAEAAEEAMFEYLTNEVGIPRSRIIVAGRSLGGGPSTWLASRQPGLAALILICTFTSCAAVAGKAASVVARGFDVFPNIRRIGKIKDFPILIVHGDEDGIVPYEHGKALYKEALAKNKTHVQLLTLPGCGHNNIEYHSGPTFWAGTRGFIETVVVRRAAQLAYARAGVEPPASFTDAIRPAGHPKQISQMHQQDRTQFRQYVSGRMPQQQQQQQQQAQAAAVPQPGAAAATPQAAKHQQQQQQVHPHQSSLEQQWQAEQQQQGQQQQPQQVGTTVLSADVFNNPDLLMQHVLAQHHAALGISTPGTATTTRHVFSNTPGTGATAHLQPSVTAATAHYSSAAVNQPLQPPHQQQQQYQAAYHQYYGQAQGPATPWEHGIGASAQQQQQRPPSYHQSQFYAGQPQQPQYARTVPVQSHLQPGAEWHQQQQQQRTQFVLDPATGTWQQR